MRTARWLVMGLLVVVGSGCARPDWIENTLVTADVTGVWTGRWQSVELNLTQSGPNVTGTLTMRSGANAAPPVTGVSIQGTVNGDVLRFNTTTIYNSFELVVNGDQMTGSYFNRSNRVAIDLVRKR